MQMDSVEQPRAEPPQVLDTRICDLGLAIEGSAVEKFVQQLYRELEQKKIMKFRPPCYLTDEWGCPSGEPVIGIPFYLARPDLAQIERENNDLEDNREIMKYLRHEAGHAFNYAYKLHRTPEWKQLFGPYRRPYRENYRPVLFSKDYVRYLPGWYAQKHPDDPRVPESLSRAVKNTDRNCNNARTSALSKKAFTLSAGGITPTTSR